MPHKTWLCFDLSTPYFPQLNQILTGTEALLASTCDDSYAKVGLAVEPIKHLAHLQVTRKWNTVHLLLPVYGNEEDIVGWVREEDVGRGWRISLRPDD
jgi:hypothetical protein